MNLSQEGTGYLEACPRKKSYTLSINPILSAQINIKRMEYISNHSREDNTGHPTLIDGEDPKVNAIHQIKEKPSRAGNSVSQQF